MESDGWSARKENPSARWNFELLCLVIQRRRAHTGKGTTDLRDIREQADEQNAKRIAGTSPRLVHEHGPAPIISHVFRDSVQKQGQIIVRRMMALGDVLASTCVARKLAEIGYDVIFQSVPEAHCILRHSPYVHACETNSRTPDIDIDGCYERDPHRTTKAFYDIFTETANQQLQSRGVKLPMTNLAPKISIGWTDDELSVLAGNPRPWIMVCPRSDSWPHRTIPDDTWHLAAQQFKGTAFWLGRHSSGSRPIVDLKVRHYEQLMRFVAIADLLVTVDTGPMHVAAALGIPTVVINQSSFAENHLSDQQDFIAIRTDLVCLNCQLPTCPISKDNPPCQVFPPDYIAETVNKRAQASVGNGVSCVIPIYRPDPARLNRCLDAVLDQADEVIVTLERDGVCPSSMRASPKIRVVVKNESNIGFGRNCNFGARHANHKWILFLNDDCFLDPGAVEKMMDVAFADVGMVAHLLRYPDGRIQHGGKYREPGAMGWGHIDYHQHEHTIKEPREMENVCGASVLVRRKAFYQAGGFDEDYFAYCEDDSLCLQIRQAGWKIMYTPHATGIHLEHQSTQHQPDMVARIQHSCKIFEQKWSWYLRKNANNNLGTFA